MNTLKCKKPLRSHGRKFKQKFRRHDFDGSVSFLKFTWFCTKTKSFWWSFRKLFIFWEWVSQKKTYHVNYSISKGFLTMTKIHVNFIVVMVTCPQCSILTFKIILTKWWQPKIRFERFNYNYALLCAIRYGS